MTNYAQFEQSVADAIVVGSTLPLSLPSWMIQLGVFPGATVVGVERVGASGGKADLKLVFDRGEQLKISIKLANADFYGNWYGHKRILKEFGCDAFNKLTKHCTRWANEVWARSGNASLFVGVSICFGKRVGITGVEFSEVFDIDDIRIIVAGSGVGAANCLYRGKNPPANLEGLVSLLVPISDETLRKISKDFKVIYRPVNPASEKSNRGKNVYTRFQPYSASSSLEKIESLPQLLELGKYVEVSPEALNHNHILRELSEDYNLKIEKKS